MKFVISYYLMMHFKQFHLSLLVLFASLINTESRTLPGCPGKCGNLTIPFPFGMNSDCYFDASFHIICNRSFKPPKPFLRFKSAEVLNISLDGKLEILNSSSSQLMGLEKREGESVPVVIQWAAGSVACHVARRNASHYACQSLHSQCKDSSMGQGYVCHCLPGYQGNPYLADGCQDIDECALENPCKGVCINLPGSFKCYCPKGSVGDGRKDGTGCQAREELNWSASLSFPIGKLTIYTIIGIVVVAPMLAMTWIAWTERQKKLEKLRQDLFEQNGGNRLRKKLSKIRNIEFTIYTAQEMESITTSYTTKTLMLRCSAGAFYRGNLSTKEVVVMVIDRVPQLQIKQFVDQLIFLSQHHTNFVRIIGCCLETLSPLIVYELHVNENDTLFHCIRSREMDSPFSCEMRVKAAAGIAKGLAYMNSHKSNTTFVHGNICSANIVMDSSNNAKIFYAAGSNLTISSSLEQENCVYKDPELIRTGKLNKKSDVYSFGVVLAELLMGRKMISLDMASDFLDVAKAGRVSEILDEEMSGEGVSEVVREVAALAERCLNLQPDKRPNMKEVAAKLSKLIPREWA